MNSISLDAIKKAEGLHSLGPADIPAAGGDLLMLGVMGGVCMALVFLCEYLFTVKKMGRAPPKVGAK